MNQRKTLPLVEAAIMIALATVMSIVKFVDMPYGGSVTLASMLPIVIISYRRGIKVGIGAGLVYATLQLLLGVGTLSYATSWQAAVAIIFLDYILAFVCVGLGGIFRGGTDARSQAMRLALGMITVCVIRYSLHVIAGATVWAGLSIPTEAALLYSLGYNATYMIPETIVNTAVAAYVGGIIDFSKEAPMPFKKEEARSATAVVYRRVGIGAIIVGFIVAVCEVFRCLQNGKNGEFTFAFISKVDWLLVGIVCAICAAVCALCLIAARRSEKNEG